MRRTHGSELGQDFFATWAPPIVTGFVVEGPRWHDGFARFDPAWPRPLDHELADALRATAAPPDPSRFR
jgi:hypothetical protein